MKLMGCLTLYLKTSASVAGLIEVVAIHSELSRYTSDILVLILLLLCFILENSCSQMYVLLNSDDVNKV